MTVQEAIAARMNAIAAEHLDGKPPAPTPTTTPTPAEAVNARLQAIAEAFALPNPPPVGIAAHTLPATLHMAGGAVVFD